MTKEIAVKDKIFDRLDVFFPQNPESSRLLLACRTADFSASRIACAVEDCDARLLNLNVTSLTLEADELAVALRVSHRDPSRVAASLERYGYRIVSLESCPGSRADVELRSRYDELMHYLNM